MPVNDPQPDEEKVQPDGEAIEWDDADLDRLSKISPAVIADSKANARRDRTLNALLNAKETKLGHE